MPVTLSPIKNRKSCNDPYKAILVVLFCMLPFALICYRNIMAGKRGIAYKCPVNDCKWAGERTPAICHYAKKHLSLEDAPYACKLCNFKTGSESLLDAHREGNKHTKLMKDHRI